MNKIETRSIKKDVAIIGMSGRFPKSENILEFWDNLVNEKELIHFYSDSELENLGVNPQLIKNERFVRNSSFLEDSGSFDYSFFGYTKEEAALMDPQIRIMHEQAWLSLEDAGYNPFNYAGKIGCFCTASDNLIWRAYVKMSASNNVNSYLIEQISNPITLSTLVSYSLNLKGPSYFVDTACSSSLVAIHIAVRSLLLKECSIALAGGVCVKSSTNIGYVYEDGMIYSKDGHCKAFDIDSSGTVKGEGVGIVVLKRLEDALRDRDHIYGIIRASSVNNDGNRKIGYTAPSVTGQYECIKVAHQIAEIEPKDISYIEAHGTGTKLGDSVEIESLNKAFNFDTSHRCSVGSLKTNIGHLDAAAGVAGLIKATLSLKHKVIPASLHYTAPNPEINFADGPFYVNSELKEWVNENQKPLIAGINSFGIGGTNAHIVLEEPPLQKKGSTPKSHQLILFSARTKTSIEKYQQKLSDFLEKNKNLNLADLSYTLKTGRKDFRYRKFAVCKDVADAQVQLSKMSSFEPFQSKERKGVVFMFSGQGSQYYRMGKQIYSEFPYFRSIVDEGLIILKNETGIDYKEVIGYGDPKFQEHDLINNTLYTQPLLFLLEYAFAKLLLKLGIRPTSMIGHSLGEYVAACISEIFSFEDGLKLILKRAQLMSQLEGGSMLSIDLPADKVMEIISPDISIAGINTDSSCVISGNNKSIEVVSEFLSSKKISFVKLKTSHAFHSTMMDPILSAYEAELNKIKLSEPKIPFISCITGSAIKKEEAMSSKYWKDHIRKTVNFSKGLDALLKEGHTNYIEIGGKSLINLLRQSKNYNSDVVVTSVSKHPKETEEDSYYLLTALATLWSNGTNINWGEYYSGEVRNKIPVPTYSFDKIVFPVKVDPFEQLIASGGFHFNGAIKEHPSEWIYEQGWKEIRNEVFREIPFDWTVCFVGENDFSKKLKEEMRKESESVIFVRKGVNYIKSEEGTITINPLIIGDYEKLVAEISGKLSGTGRIIHAWCADNLGNNEEAQELGYFSLLNIARNFLKSKTFTVIHLDFMVTDLFKVNGNEQISAIKSTALAALKIIPKEYENVYCRCIEFIKEDFEKSDASRNNLFSKLRTSPDEPVISIRGSKSWKPFYENIKVNKDQLVETQIKTGGVYVVTGAYGGMGKVISEFLTEEYNSDLILIGRGEADGDWIKSLRKGNSSIHYIQDDLSDLCILRSKIDDLRIIFDKKVDGIFHTAGLGDYAGLIADRTKENCEEIFLPKIKGTDNLFNVFKDDSPDFLVLCSSTAAVLSPFGQVAYVAANIYQNFFALEHNSKTKIVSILWDAWKETGMAIKASNRYLDKTETLALGIGNKEGIEIFKYALNSNSPELVVSIKDLSSRIAQSYEHTLKSALEFANKQNSNIGEVERPSVESVYKEAETETEKALCELWKSIFGYEQIGINDDFFELGGDSLKVMTVIQRIHKSFNIEISIGDFFKKRNIEEMAKEIDLVLEVNELNKSINRETKSNQIRL